MDPNLTAAILSSKGGGGGRNGGSVVAPSSSQVNIDTVWADTAPEALISHIQWTHTNKHTSSSRENNHTHRNTKKAPKQTVKVRYISGLSDGRK